MGWRFLPAGVDLDAASLSFSLPQRTRLQGSALAHVSTSDRSARTTMRLTLSDRLLRLAFEPHLVINVPPPLSDMGLQGVEYDLRTGAITPSVWHTDTVALRVGKGTAEDQARAWMRDLVTSTPMAIPPYDPTTDPDLVPTLRQVLANLQSAPSAPASLARDLRLAAQLVCREPLAAQAGPGGVKVPAGARVSLAVELAGGPAEVEAAPRIEAIELSTSSLVLQKDGEDQADVQRLVVRAGGAVAVQQVRPLGPAGQLAGLEGLLRLLAVLSTGPLTDERAKHLDPSAVEDLVKREIEATLQPALVQWVRDNRHAVAGMDLCDVLGIPG